MLHQWQFLCGWKCCLLACAELDDAIAALLLLYYPSGVLHVVLWKAALCQWEGSNTQQNCKADKGEGNFLRDLVGSEWS